MVWGPIVIIGTPIVRSFGGWLQHSLKDGKLEKFEVKELAKTVLSMAISGTIVYLGLSSMGIDGAAFGAAAAAFIIDKFM